MRLKLDLYYCPSISFLQLNITKIVRNIEKIASFLMIECRFFALFYTQLSVYNLPSRTLLYSNHKNWNGSVRQYPANARSATISMVADLTAHHNPKWWYVHIMRCIFNICRTPSLSVLPCFRRHLSILPPSWSDSPLSRVLTLLCILPSFSQQACDSRPCDPIQICQ